MSFYALDNLSSQTCTKIVPWNTASSRPTTLADKEAYRKWGADKATKGAFYSPFSGQNENVRVSFTNPPSKQHALVADYDADITDEQISKLSRNCPAGLLPTYLSRTFSGGVRLVWEFEKPINADCGEISEKFLKRLKKELKLEKLLPGFDPASLDPSQYFELGDKWAPVPGSVPIRTETLHRILYDSSEKADFSKFGIEVPMEKLVDEIEKKFPGRWVGKFDLGCRGVRFWDPSADNPTACIVRSTGMQCFTGDSAFVPWEEIFGKIFIREYEESRTGAAMSDIWYDGDTYWWKRVNGDWRSGGKEDCGMHLRVAYNLNRNLKGNSSEVEKVLYAIQQTRWVDATAPFLFNPQEIVVFNGRRYLNINKLSVMQPATGSPEWGENFPWFAEYMDNIWEDPEQKEYFLSWLKHYWGSAYSGRLLPGQTLFIAGPVGVGKSLLSTFIIRNIMGGGTDAGGFLLGESSFNKELLEVPLWMVDDSTSTSDWRSHQRFSDMVKKCAANQTHSYHPKFKDATLLPWNGRTIVTLNDDPQSLSIIPNLDGNILDKLMLLKFGGWYPKFRAKHELEPMILAELPHFLAWLNNWSIPEKCVGSFRYGVKPYIHKDLMAEASASSQHNLFIEVLAEWARKHCEIFQGQTEWSGTTTALRDCIENASMGATLREYSVRKIGKLMTSLAESNTDSIIRLPLKDGCARYKIDLEKLKRIGGH